MTAATIAIGLGGQCGPNGWWSCRCPVCQGEGKLGLRDGRDGLAVNCFKGCARSEILAKLKRRGLYDPNNRQHVPELTPEEIRQRQGTEEADRARRIAEAKWLWQETTVNATGTPAHTYLSSRLILLNEITEPIRFRHGHAKRNRPPAMVCRVDHVLLGSIGVHLTHLTYDGRKAAVDPARQCIGACAGGSIHFGEPRPDQWLVVGEGLETTLSVALAIGAPGWAALSATGIKNLLLPPHAHMVLIAADHDENGTGQRAANTASARWLSEGRRVKVCLPPRPGCDWNDVLLAGRIDGRRSHAS
jgi:putative DNA primase/helicase